MRGFNEEKAHDDGRTETRYVLVGFGDPEGLPTWYQKHPDDPRPSEDGWEVRVFTGGLTPDGELPTVLRDLANSLEAGKEVEGWRQRLEQDRPIMHIHNDTVVYLRSCFEEAPYAPCSGADERAHETPTAPLRQPSEEAGDVF